LQACAIDAFRNVIGQRESHAVHTAVFKTGEKPQFLIEQQSRVLDRIPVCNALSVQPHYLKAEQLI
jgi:hypothetical protein